MTRTCWRCGVDFEASGFTPDAPCSDCQLDVPGDWVLQWGQRGGGLSESPWQSRAEAVRELHAQGKSDKEIAKALGIGRSTAYQWRWVRLGLPTHSNRKHRVAPRKSHASQREAKIRVIRALYDRGLNDHQIARELEASPYTAFYWRSKVLKLPPQPDALRIRSSGAFNSETGREASLRSWAKREKVDVG